MDFLEKVYHYVRNVPWRNWTSGTANCKKSKMDCIPFISDAHLPHAVKLSQSDGAVSHFTSVLYLNHWEAASEASGHLWTHYRHTVTKIQNAVFEKCVRCYTLNVHKKLHVVIFVRMHHLSVIAPDHQQRSIKAWSPLEAHSWTLGVRWKSTGWWSLLFTEKKVQRWLRKVMWLAFLWCTFSSPPGMQKKEDRVSWATDRLNVFLSRSEPWNTLMLRKDKEVDVMLGNSCTYFSK